MVLDAVETGPLRPLGSAHEAFDHLFDLGDRHLPRHLLVQLALDRRRCERLHVRFPAEGGYLHEDRSPGCVHGFGDPREPGHEPVVPDRGGDHPLFRPHRRELGDQQPCLSPGPVHQKVDVAVGHLAVRAVQADVERGQNHAVLHLQRADPDGREQMMQSHA